MTNKRDLTSEVLAAQAAKALEGAPPMTELQAAKVVSLLRTAKDVAETGEAS